jgi:hypothetical protein
MWRTVDTPGLATGLSNLIGQWDKRRGHLPSLHGAQSLLVASDYSGDHKSSLYQVLSFLVIDPRSLAAWEETRRQIRSSVLKDDRRIAFKSLGDHRRRAALMPFLRGASRLRGVCAVFAIHRSIPSMFSRTGPSDPDKIPISLQARWTRKTFERILRIADLLSLLLAGVSWPGQNILWITDNDDIVADLNHHQDTVNILGNVSSHYLAHSLGHLRVATARSDRGDRQLEDLLSIPDLTAGAVAELLNRHDNAGGIPGLGLVIPLSRTVSVKTRFLSSWLSIGDRPLKSFVAQIFPTPDGTKLNQRILEFTSPT